MDNLLKIKIPSNFVLERQYILNVLIKDFLGIDFDSQISDEIKDYILEFQDKTIVIKDKFFTSRAGANYLRPNCLPQSVGFFKNEFTISDDIPVIFGSNDFHAESNLLTCGIDIFASAFLMLTRWEEMVNPIRDAHGRFPGEESIAFKNNFLTRPVVNEYAELLWNMLVACGFKEKREKRDFKLYLTHDIDHLFTSVTNRQIAADLCKRFDAPMAYRHFRYKYTQNPYDQYDFLMDCSERMNVQSRFYFKASDLITRYDQDNYLTTGKFRHIIRNIKARGHLIGFHPGYDTYLDESKWTKEKNLLEEAAQTKLLEGRQHYMRMLATHVHLPMATSTVFKVVTAAELRQGIFPNKVAADLYLDCTPRFRMGSSYWQWAEPDAILAAITGPIVIERAAAERAGRELARIYEELPEQTTMDTSLRWQLGPFPFDGCYREYTAITSSAYKKHHWLLNRGELLDQQSRQLLERLAKEVQLTLLTSGGVFSTIHGDR